MTEPISFQGVQRERSITWMVNSARENPEFLRYLQVAYGYYLGRVAALEAALKGIEEDEAKEPKQDATRPFRRAMALSKLRVAVSLILKDRDALKGMKEVLGRIPGGLDCLYAILTDEIEAKAVKGLVPDA
jgi:hypothetical protein